MLNALFRLVIAFNIAVTLASHLLAWLPRPDDAIHDVSNVVDAFSIGSVIYIYQVDVIPSAEMATTDLAKLTPPDRACIHGMPAVDEKQLVAQNFRKNPDFRLRRMIAEEIGDAGFSWRIEWDIVSAESGGGTGSPPRFCVLLKGDGSLSKPEWFFCGQMRLDDKREFFSTLSFKDLIVADTDAIHSDKVQQLAKDPFENIAPAILPSKSLVFRDQTFLSDPVQTLHTGKSPFEKVWRVNFIRSNIRPERIADSHSLPFLGNARRNCITTGS